MLSENQIYNSSGTIKTRALFKEVCRPDDRPLFTLGRDKSDGHICLSDLYISLTTDDPSEDSFVEVVFGDWRVWKKIKEAEWFKPHYEEWQEVATVKRKAKAFATIVKEVESNGRNSFQASKYLIEEPWKGRTKSTRQQVAKTSDEAYQGFSTDIKRLKEEGLLQ